MIDYVMYGKIIIDDIKLLDGRIITEQLGGGGPQGAFGARVWSDSVGLVSRVGTSMPAEAAKKLADLRVNTDGVVSFSDTETLRGLMIYDENDYISTDRDALLLQKKRSPNAIKEMIDKNIILPDNYTKPKVFHLITEYMHEDMMRQALALKKNGTILSLEPLIDFRKWSNKEEITAFLPQAEIVTPDWPSATGFAQSDSPKEVLKWWAKRGCSCVALRNGRHGSYVWDNIHDKMWHIPIIEVPRVDPTGCGNCYGGGLCVGWEQSRDAKIAGAMGTVSSTFMIQTEGCAAFTDEIAKKSRQYFEQLLTHIKEL